MVSEYGREQMVKEMKEAAALFSDQIRDLKESQIRNNKEIKDKLGDIETKMDHLKERVLPEIATMRSQISLNRWLVGLVVVGIIGAGLKIFLF